MNNKWIFKKIQIRINNSNTNENNNQTNNQNKKYDSREDEIIINNNINTSKMMIQIENELNGTI